jgi:DNA-binding CsgD family transcriptional regulator
MRHPYGHQVDTLAWPPGSWLPGRVTARIMETVMRQPVTEREAEVLTLLSDRLSNAQIARRLQISVRTVEHHVSALLRKHGAADRRALAEFADRGSAGVRQRLAGLPSPHTSFVGRVAERDLVRATLESGVLVTLLGRVGVGKTRLATVVAEAMAPAFGNRGGFVDLTSVRGGFVEPAVAAALGVSQRPQEPLLDTITEHLGDHPAILVLDSCEHLLDAVAELVTRVLAACPAVVVLATSRERLRLPGEHTVPVDPLPLRDDAVTLFRDRAAAADLRFSGEADTVAQICARVDGMPLAIELAAARAPALGAQGLLTALDDLVRVLTGGRTPDPRHRSLRAVLDWSHQLLDEPQQVMFRRLAIFAGPFDLPAAAMVADVGDTTVVADLLGHLVDRNLVVYLPQSAGGGCWTRSAPTRGSGWPPRTNRQRSGVDTPAGRRPRPPRWRAGSAALGGTSSTPSSMICGPPCGTCRPARSRPRTGWPAAWATLPTPAGSDRNRSIATGRPPVTPPHPPTPPRICAPPRTAPPPSSGPTWYSS